VAEPTSGDNVSVTTGFGSLSLGGKNALEILIFISILAIGGLSIYENIQRSQEHDLIACQIKLNLFMQAQKPEAPINWRTMPTDLFGCVPKFLYERDVGPRHD
jgi:hypothetical protein